MTSPRISAALWIAGLAAAGCLDIEHLDFSRDFGPASPADGALHDGGRADLAPPVPDTTATQADGGPVHDAAPPDCPAHPDCTGLQCGPDPRCHVSCGDCGDGAVCEQGLCRSAPPGCPATKDCGGRVCGPDPVCGETCGACADGTTCNVDGACVCAPRCNGLECGDDGCGGTCGMCGGYMHCVGGHCVPAPCPESKDCMGQTCGIDPVCHLPCGDCQGPDVCDATGHCVCQPDCAGGARMCGSDGCGGSCGECGPHAACNVDGQCVCEATACGATCCDRAAVSCSGALCCTPSWRVPVPIQGPRQLVADGAGHLYLNGSHNLVPGVAALNTCDGGVSATGDVNDLAFLAGGASLGEALLGGGDLLLTGTTGLGGGGDGYLARFSRPDLHFLDMATFQIGDGGATPQAVAVDADSHIFLAGEDGLGDFLAGEVAPMQPACGWVVGSPGRGRSAVFGRGLVWMTGTVEDRLALVGRHGSCLGLGPAGACDCLPAEVDVRVDAPNASHTEGLALAAGASEMYVAGFAQLDAAPDDGEGVIFGSQGAQTPRTVFVWNPTQRGDTFFALAANGDTIYLAGGAGMADPLADFDVAATAHLVIVNGTNGVLVADRALGPGVATGVALEGDAVFVAVAGPGGTEVLRCPVDGPCPAP